MKTHKTTFTLAGREFTLETGKLAPQAESAVLAQYGETVVLATVAVSAEDSDRDYFPLSVEFIEKLYAGGRIKGSRWIKREGRPSDDLVLKARLIDRSIRPLFPKSFKKDVQVIVTVLSVDMVNNSDMVGMIAVSAALHNSSIPWNGPIGAVRMGTKDGGLIVNPTNEEMISSDLDLVVSGSEKKVVMIEAGANQVAEDTMFEAIEMAQREIAAITQSVAEFQKKAGQKKQEISDKKDTTLIDLIKKSHEKEIISIVTEKATKVPGAQEKFADLVTELEKKHTETYTRGDILTAIDQIFEKNMRATIMKDKKRVDGRGIKDLRPLFAEVSVLPRVHGSAIFQRGNTQALTITTLGSIANNLLMESAEGETEKRYIHYYNMPPFSVGETGRVGYPGRREIGHGALAERALEPVIPSAEEFPYTIQVISEVLSSNGSTSMASTCGSTLSLMDAGVPLKAPVAGISVGLVTDGDDYTLITDIMGIEDFGGDMDFKVAGTTTGITAIQLDIKIDGLTLPMIKETFAQAHEARMKILDVMLAAIPQSREHVSQYAPKVVSLAINPEKIGELIGPGGRMIKTIIAETGSEVNVEDDGTVTVSGSDQSKVTEAIEWIQGIVKDVEVDEEYEGTVTRLMPFGAFVEVLPGKEGLVHLSKMSTEFVERPEDIVKEGDTVKVRVVEIDSQGRINLSMLFGEDAKKKEQHGGGRSGGSSGRGRSYDSNRNSGGYRGGGRRFDRNDRRGNNDRRSGGRRQSNYKHPHLEEEN